MTRMKSPITFGLVAAIPIEALNFRFLGFPIDVGLPADTSWYWKLIAYQWLYLHWAGLISLDWIEHVVGCQQLNVVMGCHRLDTCVLLVSGYIGTALLLIAVILGFRWIRSLARKYSARRN